jgi:hypothetical protein
MVVLSNARTDQEDEFNLWYDEHMRDTIDKLDGFAAAQRFELSQLPGAPDVPYRYLAIYEVEDDRLERAYEQFRYGRRERAEAAEAGREPMIKVSDTLDPSAFLVGFYSAITARTPSLRLSGADEAAV